MFECLYFENLFFDLFFSPFSSCLSSSSLIPLRFFSYHSSMSKSAISTSQASTASAKHQSIKPQSSLKDLPQELLTFVLLSLPPFQKVRASAVNSEWRDVINSNGTILFSSLDLTSEQFRSYEDEVEDGYRNKEEFQQDQEVEMTETIGALLNSSSLCNNRLKDVGLDIFSFWSDLILEQKAAASSRLTILFQVLNLSKTLSRIHLQTPAFDLEKRGLHSLPDPSISLVFLIGKLEKLPSLKVAEIEASILCDLTSKSDSRLLTIQNNSHGPTKTYRRLDQSSVIRAMNRFTTGAISQIESHFGMQLTRKIRDELWTSSRQSLEEVELNCLDLSYFHPMSYMELFADCPKLSSLSIRPDGYQDLNFPSGRELKCKFKTLKFRPDGVIKVGIPFFRWLGDQLEELELGFVTPKDIGDSFFNLFQPFGQCLKKLKWNDRVGYIGGYQSPSGSLNLPSLTTLIFEGHIELVNFLLQIQFSSLEKLHLTAYQCDSDQYLDHRYLVEALRSCRGTLKSVKIGESLMDYPKDLREGFGQEKKVIAELEELEKIDKTFSLPLIHCLNVQTRSDVFLEVYASLKVPSSASVTIEARPNWEQ